MKKIFHSSNDRGYANHGWLKAHHSFSFASWYDPNKIKFGKLRVLNDDNIEPGAGFGLHPHENMEIVTIPLYGSLAHKDNTGSNGVINHNEIQVMSAGTGIFHSEFNASEIEICNLLQIWIFPNKNGHPPRYDQLLFNPEDRKNKIQTFISPNKSEGNLWLNQNAYFSWCDLDKNLSTEYYLNNSKNGVYIFLIDGVIKVADQLLSRRDAIGIWEIEKLKITSDEKSEILLIEVPMF